MKYHVRRTAGLRVAVLQRRGPFNRRLKPFESSRYCDEKKSPIFYAALLRLSWTDVVVEKCA